MGNFHTLAFRLGPGGIEGVFEHHTGEIDRPRLEGLLDSLAQGTLTNAEVFDSMGHGALVYNQEPFSLEKAAPRLVVTGPRRSLLAGSSLRPYFRRPVRGYDDHRLHRADLRRRGLPGGAARTASTALNGCGSRHFRQRPPVWETVEIGSTGIILAPGALYPSPWSTF